MKQLICIVAAGLLWQSADAQSYRIAGQLEGLKNDSVFVVVRKSRHLPADTLRARATAGKFQFKGKVDGVLQGTLVPGSSFQSRKFFNFYLEPGNIKLAGHVDTMDYIRANGTPNNDLQTAGRLKEKVQYAAFQKLLDFWASWCVPCRAENPYVVAAYQQYKDKGLTVVSVSMDSDGKKWKEAIAKDGLTWQHISELKFLDEPIANLYGVQSIPDNFLLSPDGRIVASQLRGEELKKH